MLRSAQHRPNTPAHQKEENRPANDNKRRLTVVDLPPQARTPAGFSFTPLPVPAPRGAPRSVGFLCSVMRLCVSPSQLGTASRPGPRRLNCICAWPRPQKTRAACRRLEPLGDRLPGRRILVRPGTCPSCRQTRYPGTRESHPSWSDKEIPQERRPEYCSLRPANTCPVSGLTDLLRPPRMSSHIDRNASALRGRATAALR